MALSVSTPKHLHRIGLLDQSENNYSKTHYQSMKEGNVLFNDAFNTFYLRLYGVRLKKEMFYLTTHSTHFIYGYMVSV